MAGSDCGKFSCSSGVVGLGGLSPGERKGDTLIPVAMDRRIGEELCITKRAVAMPGMAFGIVQKAAGV